MNEYPSDEHASRSNGHNGHPKTNGKDDPAAASQKGNKAKAPAKSNQRTLGPVRNLEEHVRADWWRGLFNALYLKTDADVVDDQAITRREVSLFQEILEPAPDDRMLDLCCGQGRHTLEFARCGFKGMEGLDRSRYLIQRAKDRAKREGLPARFREGDARKLPYPTDHFDTVMILGNSFGYFDTVQEDLRVLREVFRVLKPGGRLLIDVTDGDYLRANFQARSWEWIDKKHFVCRERSLSEDGQRMISREVITHAEKGVLADQFYAERLYSPEQLDELLQGAGFSGFTTHAALSPDSERNQDLGMMARRIVATARVKKAWTPQRKKSAAVPHVAVVMGDPTKPDAMKPFAVFDEDDFHVIDTLKKALGELGHYKFTYLNRHDTLTDDLRKLKGKVDFVLNLCDEGFSNDPRKELHVPALLDLLEIPYTGGNPQCLAYCYDKSLVRGVAKEMGIPVPEACFVQPDDATFELPFSFPAIVKPNSGDCSFGITQRSVAWNSEELLNAISEIRERFGYDKPLLVEEFLTGKDLTIGIIGNPPEEGYTVLPITEEDYEGQGLSPDLPRICGYEAKWLPDSPYWGLKAIPAELPVETRRLIEEYSLKLSERLECRDYVRLDWRLSASGVPKLLEVNPNPGWCWDGHLANMSAHAGLSYARMLDLILQAAVRRLKIGEDAPVPVKAEAYLAN